MTKDKAFLDLMVTPEAFEATEALQYIKEKALRDIGYIYAKKYATSEEFYQVEWTYRGRYEMMLFNSESSARDFMKEIQGSSLMKKIRYTLGE